MFLLFPCDIIAQVKVRNGSSLTINPGTTLTVSGNNHSLELEQTGQVINNGKIVLDTNVSVIEPAGNPITGSGYEETTRNFTIPLTGNNIAGLGLGLTTSGVPGVTTIRRGHLSYSDSLGNPGIDRWFEINPANNSMLNATLRFWYDSTELNGITENDLLLHRSENNGYSWMNEGGAVNSAMNYIERTGIDSFALHTAFMKNIVADPLPASFFCAGDTLLITFTAPGTYTTLNTFTVQLSDITGSFSAPVSIGTLQSNIPGTITAIIPTSTVGGSNYRVRVMSSDMVLTGAPSAPFTINESPLAPAQPTGPALFCLNSPDTYYSTTGSPNAVSYNWYISPVNAGSLTQLGDSVLINWDDNFSGTVDITVTSVNNCGENTSGSTLSLVVDACTSVSEISNTAYISVYPNPASDWVKLEYGTGFNYYEIFNSLGELVRGNQLDMENRSLIIDLTSLAKGVYHLRVSGNYFRMLKVVLK